MGDYTQRLYEKLSQLLPIDLLHVPIRGPFERSLFEIFRGRDAVHIQYPTEGWGKSLLPSLLPLAKGKCKLILTLHEWSEMNPLRRRSIGPLVSAADGFVFVTPMEQEAFRASVSSSVRAKPSRVIPIGVNLEVPQLPPEEVLAFRESLLADGGHDLLLTHFGFIHVGKQPEELLDTVAYLAENGRRPLLVVIGGFQADKELEKTSFESDLRERGLANHVKLLGFVKDERLAGLYMAAADANISLFADGLSPRRGSFWYAAQFGGHLLTTAPARIDDFGSVRKRLVPPQVVLVPANASAVTIYPHLLTLPPYRPFAYEPIPAPRWEDIAAQHLAFYRELGL